MLYAKVIEGSFTALSFHDFLDGLLDQMQPFPAPNSVIMDNAHIHKDPQIIDLIHVWQVLYIYIIDLSSKLS